MQFVSFYSDLICEFFLRGSFSFANVSVVSFASSFITALDHLELLRPMVWKWPAELIRLDFQETHRFLAVLLVHVFAYYVFMLIISSVFIIMKNKQTSCCESEDPLVVYK